MYTGTMIEDLIAMVARAEQRAHPPEVSTRQQQAEPTLVYAQPLYEAPHAASLAGVA